uniref:Uncharacterized protein n=1 Tax=Strigamia maritima TaxID=126957 RepID=T1JKP6_STRMM
MERWDSSLNLVEMPIAGCNDFDTVEMSLCSAFCATSQQRQGCPVRIANGIGIAFKRPQESQLQFPTISTSCNNFIVTAIVELGVGGGMIQHIFEPRSSVWKNTMVTRLNVSWVRRRDFHILTVGMYTYSSDQRFQIVNMPQIEDWTLQIKYVERRDQGVYECQVSSDPPISLFVNLNIVGNNDPI